MDRIYAIGPERGWWVSGQETAKTFCFGIGLNLNWDDKVRSQTENNRLNRDNRGCQNRISLLP